MKPKHRKDNNMTDKVQKIRKEVERLKSLIDNNSFLSDYERGCNDGREDICDEFISILDSFKEEPVSEDVEEIAWNLADKKCHLDVAVFTPDEVKKERGKMQFTWQDLYDAVVFGAEWKEKRMMAKAINTEASLIMSVPSICISLPLGINVGDRVRVIVIKTKED